MNSRKVLLRQIDCDGSGDMVDEYWTAVWIYWC